MKTIGLFLALCLIALPANAESRFRQNRFTAVPDYEVPPLPLGARVLVVVGQTPEAEAHYRDWARAEGWAFFVREPGDGKTAACPRGWPVGVHENEVASGGRLVKYTSEVRRLRSTGDAIPTPYPLVAPSSPSNALPAEAYFEPRQSIAIYDTPTVTCHEAAQPMYSRQPSAVSHQPLAESFPAESYTAPVYRGGDRVIASDPGFAAAPGPEYVVGQSSWMDGGASPRQQTPAVGQRSFSAGSARAQSSGFSTSFSGGFGAASCGPSG